MLEWTAVWFLPLRFSIVFVFVTCYVIGGRDGGEKWIRRFVGTGLFASFCLLLANLTDSFSWWLLPSFIPLTVGVSMGYGADDNDVWGKVLRRGSYGAVIGLSGLLIGITQGNLFLGMMQLCLAIGTSLLFGIFNPTKAVEEEALIATGCTLLIPFMV